MQKLSQAGREHRAIIKLAINTLLCESGNFLKSDLPICSGLRGAIEHREQLMQEILDMTSDS